MTRINSAINPANLTDQHLLAELRELPRIFTAVEKRIKNNIPFNDIPKKFTLGIGHCKFFYDKTFFLFERHRYLRLEYRKRFNKFWNYGTSFNKGNEFYLPTQEEKQLLIERISTRILESNQTPRYYGKQISKEQAIEILNS